MTRYEVRGRRQDGIEVWISSSSSPLLGDDGSYQGALVMFQDISERKKAEEALQESEAKYRSLFENLPEEVSLLEYVLNEAGEVVEGTYLDANPPVANRLGMPRSELIGRRVGELLGRENLERMLPLVRQVRAENRPLTDEYSYAPDDAYFLQLIAPIDDRRFIVSATNITEVKRAQGEAEQYAERLERSDTELKQFAYVVPHDLPEPLTIATAYLSHLQDRYRDHLCDHAKMYRDYAIESGTTAAHFIRDLVDCLLKDPKEPSLHPTDRDTVFEEAAENLALQIREGGARLTHRALSTIKADKKQMAQVLTNLISNAVKFCGD
jgi:PAS domain S-box-containing protein